MPTNITETISQKAKDMRLQGKTYAVIAYELGLSYSSAFYLAKGIKVSQQRKEKLANNGSERFFNVDLHENWII